MKIASTLTESEIGRVAESYEAVNLDGKRVGRKWYYHVI
jgi:hypothetical protein